MKIISHLPPSNLKAGRDARLSALLAAHNRRVRYKGGVYLITVVSLGGKILADAQEVGIPKAPLIDLNGTAGIARDLKQLVTNRLFT